MKTVEVTRVDNRESLGGGISLLIERNDNGEISMERVDGVDLAKWAAEQLARIEELESSQGKLTVVVSEPIGHTEDTDRLYRAEEKATDAVKAAGRELHALRIMREGVHDGDFYAETIPQTLAMLVEAFAGHSCVLARKED